VAATDMGGKCHMGKSDGRRAIIGKLNCRIVGETVLAGAATTLVSNGVGLIVASFCVATVSVEACFLLVCGAIVSFPSTIGKVCGCCGCVTRCGPLLFSVNWCSLWLLWLCDSWQQVAVCRIAHNHSPMLLLWFPISLRVAMDSEKNLSPLS